MPAKAIHQFPHQFLWGCATAAHQVEGQNVNDWWRWEKEAGRIFGDQRVGRACDWWAGRYNEDFDRAAAMNNNAQRISIEWSRIEPRQGVWDEWAIAHYRDMVKAIVDRGMTPMITLHHFTNPLWIADHDSWVWDQTPILFERYVRKVVSALSDLCSLWCTVNEPMAHVMWGYMFGKWPPGLRSKSAAARATVNMVWGHAMAYHTIKDIQPHAQVGYAHAHIGATPSEPTFIHWPVVYGFDRGFNRVFLHGVRDGWVWPLASRPVPVPQAKGTLDWIGLQYYTQFELAFSLRRPGTFFVGERKPKGLPEAPGMWGGLNPDALRHHIAWLWSYLKKPIYITESGVPDPDDSIRPAYLVETIRAMWKSLNNGIPVKGFLFWSLLDNFEWAEGYDPRFNFGLYKVNFETQERIARPSSQLFTEICKQNGLSSAMVERYAPELIDAIFPGEPGKSKVKLKPSKAPSGM